MKLFFLLLLSPAFLLAQQSDFTNAESLYKQEKYNQAKPLFENYLKANVSNDEACEYLGDIASYNKDWDAAMEYYKTLVAKDAKNANYHFKYGGALGMKALAISKLRALTYIDDIKEQFTTAAELDPKHINTRWALVELYLQLPGIVGGSESKAKKYADELQAISPVDGYLSKGYVEEYYKRSTTAEAYYKKAIALGGSPVTYEKLTNLYEKNNRPKDALNNASKSLKLYEERNQLNYQIGKISAEYGMEPQLGIECLNRYIDRHSYRDGVPKDWAYYRLAQIYKNLGENQLALNYANKALSDNSDFEEVLALKRSL